MLKLSKFCLKMYNFKNNAIKVIIMKRLLHLRSSRIEVYIRLTIRKIPQTLHRKISTRKGPPDNTACKVI